MSANLHELKSLLERSGRLFVFHPYVDMKFCGYQQCPVKSLKKLLEMLGRGSKLFAERVKERLKPFGPSRNIGAHYRLPLPGRWRG
jgi:hypothetical protein